MTFERVIKDFTTRGLRVEDVRGYLDAGGDINHKDAKMGWSLLHFAAEHCNSEVIRLLVAAGAGLDVVDHNGWTSLHVAVDSDLDSSSRAGRRPTAMPTAQTLIELGAHESVRATDGSLPRDIALSYGEQVLYDSLLRARAGDR